MQDPKSRAYTNSLKPELQIRREKIYKDYKHGPISLENLDVDTLVGFPVLKLSPQATNALKLGRTINGPHINVSRNPRLTSLKGLQTSIYDINASNCGLTDLTTAPQIIQGNASFAINNITNLKGIGKQYLRHVYGSLNLYGCPITSHLMGLFFIRGLTEVLLGFITADDHPLGPKLLLAMSIINKHLGSKEHDMMECQEELIQNGLKEYARV